MNSENIIGIILLNHYQINHQLDIHYFSLNILIYRTYEIKKQLNSIWTAEEIDFSQDYKDYITLDYETQHVIKMILAFFDSLDSIVNINIEKNLINNIVSLEAMTCDRFQIMMEGIHTECYSLMI